MTRSVIAAAMMLFAASRLVAQTDAVDTRPLPPMSDLIGHATAREKAAEDQKKYYTYKQTTTADEFDSHGNKKGTHTDVRQIWMVKDMTVSEHVEHDGKPLPPDEAAKEHERVEKRIADIKSGAIKPAKQAGVSLSAADLLKLATFSNERRVDLDGRPTIVFDYIGNPDAKATDIGQEVMKKLRGEVWIDENTRALTRLKGTLDSNFRVAGGLLVNVKTGSWLDLDLVRVNNELWMPHHLGVHVDGRLLLFKGFDSDLNATYSDYRKMQTSITIRPGSQVIGADGQPIPGLSVEPGETDSVPTPPSAPPPPSN